MYSSAIKMNVAFEEQIKPRTDTENFNEYTKPKIQNKKE